jgi:hypothetical protein
MTKVHVGMLELPRAAEPTGIERLMLFTQTRSAKRPIWHPIKGGRFLQVHETWRFVIAGERSEELTLVLKRRCLLGGNKVIGGCSLPLDRFPADQVVREWFAMSRPEQMDPEVAKTMILLEVHVNRRGVKRFGTAHANLRVLRLWERRHDSLWSCLAHPQTVYAVQQEHAANELPILVPVGSLRCWHVQTPQPVKVISVYEPVTAAYREIGPLAEFHSETHCTFHLLMRFTFLTADEAELP